MQSIYHINPSKASDECLIATLDYLVQMLANEPNQDTWERPNTPLKREYLGLLMEVRKRLTKPH